MIKMSYKCAITTRERIKPQISMNAHQALAKAYVELRQARKAARYGVSHTTTAGVYDSISLGACQDAI
ncbi:hypothetical protein O3M35_013293 [Rhynocoris fuscipes]|uniref:Uncharacterized protein n=1 Tax=Rhynocoris fuscipes TaxID=488301 RepID=A0AAW1CJK2_9HEMI